jgi:ribosomal-protein-serine acetyltransferase
MARPGTALRPVRVEDAAEVFRLVEANRAHLAEWLPWPKHLQTEADERSFLAGCVAGRQRGSLLTWAVVDGGAIVGVVGYNYIDWTRRMVYVGYWLAAPAQGRGLMTQAVRAACAYAFDAGLRIGLASSYGASQFRARDRFLCDFL